jgi:hypothetical protein
MEGMSDKMLYHQIFQLQKAQDGGLGSGAALSSGNAQAYQSLPTISQKPYSLAYW